MNTAKISTDGNHQIVILPMDQLEAIFKTINSPI